MPFLYPLGFTHPAQKSKALIVALGHFILKKRHFLSMALFHLDFHDPTR